MKFSRKQIIFINELGIKDDLIGDIEKMSDETIWSISDKVSVHLMIHGFDEDYKPTKDGLMCESILDILGDLED